MSAAATRAAGSISATASASYAAAARGAEPLTTPTEVTQASLPSRQKQIKCFTCGGLGHRAAECPSKRHDEDAAAEVPAPGQLPVGTGKAGGDGAARKSLYCHKCRKRGHVKSECPSLARQDSSASNSPQELLRTVSDGSAAASERATNGVGRSGRDSNKTTAGVQKQGQDQQRTSTPTPSEPAAGTPLTDVNLPVKRQETANGCASAQRGSRTETVGLSGNHPGSLRFHGHHVDVLWMYSTSSVKKSAVKDVLRLLTLWLLGQPGNLLRTAHCAGVSGAAE